MEKTKIFLTDDHAMFRAGLKSLITKDPELAVTVEAEDGQELLEKLEYTECDLLVLDLAMPNIDGITALKIIHEKYPDLKIIILTMQKDPEHFRRALNYGVFGYVLKDDAYEQLVLAVRAVLKGKHFFSPSVARQVTDRYIRSVDESEGVSLEILTQRERQVLKLIAGGEANKNIAEKLKISIRTVETHRLNLSNKLGIKSTAGLVKYAISKGLV